MIQGAIAPLSNILSGATRTAIDSIGKLSGPVQVLPKNSINQFFQNLFKTAPKVAIPQGVKTGSGTLSRNIAITGGTILGTSIVSSAFLSSPQGQNTLTTFQGITDLFNKNPIIPIGLLILGGLIVVSVIKK